MTKYKLIVEYKGVRHAMPEMYNSATAAAIAAEELDQAIWWAGVRIDWVLA